MVSANAYPVMGGVETHIHEVAPRISRAGFDVSVLTTDRSGLLPRFEQQDDVPVARVAAYPADRDYYFAPGLFDSIQPREWDLVHCQGYHTFVAPLAMAAANRANIPYVLTFHSGGHDSATRNSLRGVQHLALRPLLMRARRLVAVSDWEARHFASELRLSRKRFVTIPNGAELPPAATAKRHGRAPSSDTLILAIGRLEKYKGHQRLIAAMPEFLKLSPGARLRIVGGGDYDGQLRRLAEATGVGDRIEIGPVDPADRAQMASLISQAALVVSMSEYESQGIAVLEALAGGRRVLVANTSALSEFVQRGVAAGVPLDISPRDLAQAMCDEINGPVRPPLELPTWDACAAQLADLYREVLAA